MTKRRISFSMLGGVDRSFVSYKADRSSFFDLVNFRQQPRVRGVLEQTPYFDVSTTKSQGTYWNGGASTTEPTTSRVRGYNVSDGYTFTDYCVWAGSTQMQVFYQVTQPASENVNTGCLVVINSISGLGITLGSTLDVEIDSATTFRWRKNSGAWTAGVACSTTGTDIDGTNATVYFLASSGFTIGDLWEWRRTDANFESSSNVSSLNRTTQRTVGTGSIYYISQDNRLMSIKLADTTPYAISTGYRAVYGRVLTIFEDHIIVGGFSKTAVSNGARSMIVGWSDNVTVENFIATDTNEADQKTLVSPLNGDWVLGVVVVKQQLFVFSVQISYYSPYLGLPNVFTFTEFARFKLLNFYYPVVPTDVGVYLLASRWMFFFDGSTMQMIKYPVSGQELGSSAGLGSVYGAFDSSLKELIIVSTTLYLFTYQEESQTWYKRSVDFEASSASEPTALYVDNDVYVGVSSRRILRSSLSQSSAFAPVFDASGGTAFVTPKITFQAYAGEAGLLSLQKEVSEVFLSAAVATTASNNYSTDADCQFKIYWYLLQTGQVSGAPSTDTNATWVNTATDGTISFPRQPFRAIAFEIQLVGLDGTKPPMQGLVYGFDALVQDVYSANQTR